jgi:hypothetical protein
MNGLDSLAKRGAIDAVLRKFASKGDVKAAWVAFSAAEILGPAKRSIAQFCAVFGRKHLYHFMVGLYHFIYTSVTQKWAKNGHFWRTDAAFQRRISEVNVF